ncbi:MAG: HprK-related kinase A [Gammaproteobacteria bacterium]|nr:HprK-related kinase A [Gammaproteobacteria bacterium]
MGPFSVSLHSTFSSVSDRIGFFYRDFLTVDDDQFIDFHIHIKKPDNLRHWIRPQSVFSFDGFVPFKPLPANQAFPIFEWGLNWCIATTAHQLLIIHAAVVEKNNHAIIMPGNPGAGKSTLCAALVCRGWRLLSDEMALITPNDLKIIPIPRPIGLKNESIGIMGNFGEKHEIGPSVMDTSKGTVAHMRPPTESVKQANTGVYPGTILFPTYSAGSGVELEEVGKAIALARMTEQSFNSHILGVEGIKVMERVVSRSSVFNLKYSNLDTAIARIDELIR